MSSGRSLFCLVFALLLSCPRVGWTQSVDVSELAKDELSAAIQVEGACVQAKRWKDEKGTHVFLAYQREGDNTKYGLRGKTFAPLVEGVELDLDTFEVNLMKATSGEADPTTYPNQSIENGRYETEKDFDGAPPAFLEYVRTKCKKHMQP